MSESKTPFWSVMVPTYNPNADYLSQALQSVLMQDPGSERMQIEVIDDASPNVDTQTLVKEIAGKRVLFSREGRNLGLAGVWNRCIERARGEWVHILHQDDLVYPGFYAKLHKGLQGCDDRVSAAFTRFAISNADGQWTLISAIYGKDAGVLKNWKDIVSATQPVQCAAVVVRKSAYDTIGKFSPTLRYSLDWEMWQRLAANYDWWHVPEILACWRTHGGSATARLAKDNSDVEDVLKMLKQTKNYWPPEMADQAHRRARAYWGSVVLQTSRCLLVKSEWRAAWRRAIRGLQVSCNYEVLDEFLLFLSLQLRLWLVGIIRIRTKLCENDKTDHK